MRLRYNAVMKYLFFDLDGTLTYSDEGITKSIVYALESLGMPRPDEKLLRACIGPPLTDGFARYFHLTGEQNGLAVKKFRERYHDVGWKENRLIEGAKEALLALKERGKTLAVATGKPTVFAERILSYFEIRDLFSCVAGSGLDGSRSKKREEIAAAMNGVRASAHESAMIGDRKNDVEGAKACGIFAAGVSFGYAEEGELARAGADIVFDDFIQLQQYFI